MNKFPIFFLLVIGLSFIIASCRIDGTLLGMYSYSDKTAKEHPGFIQRPDMPMCKINGEDTSVVYAVNGKEVKNCITNFDNSLVYIWRARCHSSICISPAYLQRMCDEKGIELFVVAEYYDYPFMTLDYSLKRPIFGVDCDYYRTDRTKKYMKKFLSDLFEPNDDQLKNYFFLFKEGKMINSGKSVEETLEP